MKYHRRGFSSGYTIASITLVAVVVLFFVSIIYFFRQSSIPAQKESQPQPKYQAPSPEVFQQRQEAARKRLEERQAQEEIDRQTQIALEKENAIYEITFIQIDRELNFRLYTLRHRKNNTKYMLVVTPEGSSITPLNSPE